MDCTDDELLLRATTVILTGSLTTTTERSASKAILMLGHGKDAKRKVGKVNRGNKYS